MRRHLLFLGCISLMMLYSGAARAENGVMTPPIIPEVKHPVAPTVAPNGNTGMVPPNPCAGFQVGTAGYVVCQDRAQKMDRLRQNTAKRDEDLKVYYERMSKKAAAKVQSVPMEAKGTNESVPEVQHQSAPMHRKY